MKNILLATLLITLSGCGKAIVDGKDGVNGKDGTNGRDGSSCSVTQVSNGSIINCQDGTSAIILNGLDGQDGADGQNGMDGVDGQSSTHAYSIVDVIKLCSGAGEILFRTHNNSLIAHYSHGSRQFLTILQPGSYQTTDGLNCQFSVSSSMVVRDSDNNIWNP